MNGGHYIQHIALGVLKRVCCSCSCFLCPYKASCEESLNISFIISFFFLAGGFKVRAATRTGAFQRRLANHNVF